MTRDPDDLRRRLDNLTRCAARIRAHLPDLHHLGWEPPTSDAEKVNGGRTDWTPRTGHPAARRLYGRLSNEILTIEAELIGLDRAMHTLFYAGSQNPEPSRGSMISRADFDRQLARQRRRPDTPTRLVDQPQHPGARR